MVDFGKMIDKLIEISTNQDISDEVKCNLDDVIDELIHLEIENNGEKVLDSNELMDSNQIVPDFSDLSPEEMEEIKQFELFVRDVMNNKLALA
jgi:hypothetical protein|tara:strand:+ start:2020 stop:2298 length:279 start_codon:yes stop_codon:yes gene_type:complete